MSQKLAAGNLRLDEGDAHLEFEELEALAEGSGPLPELELHRQHVRDCPMCCEELRELQVLAEQRRRKRLAWRFPAFGAIAASIAMAVVLSQRAPEAPALREAPQVVSIRDAALELAADRSLVLTALESGEIQPGPEARDWNRGREQLLGAPPDGAPSVIAPVSVAVETDRPVFRWSPVPGAASYRVEVYDSTFNEAASSPAVTATEWTSERPLHRAAAYSWIVAARVGGRELRFPQPPAPEAKFEVLSQLAADELAHARSTKSNLLLAVVAGRYGLWADALAALDEAARLNPANESIDRLRRGVQSRVK